MRTGPVLLIAAGAVIALAVWPLAARRLEAAPGTVASAPVNRDYLQRDRMIAFYEKQVRSDPKNQIFQRTLAGQYMNRFREQGDVGDIARAENMARRSLKNEPDGNIQAEMVLASTLLTYHKFHEALVYDRHAVAGEPFNDNARAQVASLLMELGRYEQAEKILRHPRQTAAPNPTWMSIQARYDEVTGNMSGARSLIAQAEAIVDRSAWIPAYTRSWYHMRSAQLAWEAGDDSSAQREYAACLKIFPDNSMALMWEARYYRSIRDWPDTLRAAKRSADLYPLPQVLGYEADAQRALGDAAGAKRTVALIEAEQRLFNVQGINDRLLANFYAQNHIRLADALHFARIDRRQRGNEVYADDTMAWVLAALGRWKQARPYAVQATRFNTQDAVLEYHAAIVALHTGHRAEGIRRLNMALALNPEFHPVYAADARSELAGLNASRLERTVDRSDLRPTP